MRWPWEPSQGPGEAEKPEEVETVKADAAGPISAEEVEKVKNQLTDWQRRLEVVERRIDRLPPPASAR